MQDGSNMHNALVKTQANELMALRTRFIEEKYNLLLPTVHIGSLPAGTQLAVREVLIDTHSVQGRNRMEFPSGEVYMIEGKLGLGKIAINKIAAAAGITWEYSRRVDDRSDPYYCEFEVRAKVTDFDGTVRYETANKTLDLRENGKDTKAAKTPRQLAQMRQFITEHCETKAKNRAVRAILSLKTSYTVEELERPFIVPKLVPDTSDPIAQQVVLANMYGATQALFGSPQQKVVDASLDEGAPETDSNGIPPSDGDGDEAAGDTQSGSLPPAASEPAPRPAAAGGSEPPDEPPPMPSMDEPTELTNEERDERLRAIWNRVARVGMQPKAWGAFTRSNTGRVKASELTREDIEQLETAAEAYVDAQGGVR